jgi:ComF family protein
VLLLQRAGRAVLDLLFPPRCCSCGKFGVFLCSGCIAAIEPSADRRCLRCGAPTGLAYCPNCRVVASPLDGLSSAAVFQPPIQPAIHAFKYEGVSDLALPLGEHMVRFWMHSGLRADVLVPVALHPRRVRERGYNQAVLLARVLSARTGVPVDERLVVRSRDTRPQVGLDAVERHANMVDAFSCTARVDGQAVAVIDDVCTTGATLEACAAALKAAGAASVRGYTLARARWGEDGLVSRS